MSKETLTWLNTQTLIGMTSKRGKAWHYVASEQGTEPNHYEFGVPIDDVLRRLLDWDALDAKSGTEVIVRIPATMADFEANTPGVGMRDDGTFYLDIPDPTRQALVHSKTHAILGHHSASYAQHPHAIAVVGNVAKIIGASAGELVVGSAGLLEQGATAWLSIEVPENFRTEHGVEFRPNLLAVGSHNGKHATTYKRVVTNVVCDNTMAMALREETEQKFKIAHRKHSMARVLEAREALDLIDFTGQQFAEETTLAIQTEVTDKQWRSFLQEIAPVLKDDEQTERTRNFNMRKQDRLHGLWNNDERVNPWKNTAWGVVQAVNTWEQHEKNVKGEKGASPEQKREERNRLRAVSGDFDKLDRGTVATLDKILANA